MIRARGSRPVPFPAMDRSLWAVLFGTFTLRVSTGLTGALLVFYAAELTGHHGIVDQLLGLGPGEALSPFAFSVLAALFFVSELLLSPVFGILSDRAGHHRVMQLGPLFGIVAAVLTWATTNLPLLGATRLLEGSSTAASVPSILGYIAAATRDDEGLRGRAAARFEAATLAGLLAGFVLAGLLYTAVGPAAFLLNAVLYAVSMSIYRYGVSPSLDVAPAAAAPGPGAGAPASRWSPDLEPAAGPPASALGRGLGLDRYRRILARSHVWLLAPTWIAINAVLGLYTTQTIFQLVRERDPAFADQLLMGGFEPVQVSAGLAVGGLLFFAGLIYWGNRFQNLRRSTIILYGLGGGLLLVAGAVAINHSEGQLPILRLVYAVPVVAGLFVLAGATPAAIGLLADVTEAYPEDRGAIMGLYSVFLGLGQIGGSLIAGGVATAAGLDGILLASVVLLSLAVIPLLALRRHEHFLGPSQPEVID
ncbi:MAG: MFS transporter [Chloroflexota bacterium]|nr:MAG: MFS transporter [Chloroflexota bacterium]